LFFAIEKLLFSSMLPSRSKLDNGERNAALFFIVTQTPVLQNTETPRRVDGCANVEVEQSFHCCAVTVDLGQIWQAAYNKRLCVCSQTHSNHAAKPSANSAGALLQAHVILLFGRRPHHKRSPYAQ
jgi:hypothetical protein